MKSITPILLISALLTTCITRKKNLIIVEGNAQGTTYHISYLCADHINYKPAFDSILLEIDTSMSTYLPVSMISRINKNDSSVLVDQYFIDVFNKSMEVSKRTGGLFDVTVGTLVNAWGFGNTKKANLDSSKIDSLLQFVGYHMVHLEGNKIVKSKPEISLDFNAIAQGYTVDVLASYLEDRGIQDYLVELGGELKGSGKKGNEFWKVGIDRPSENTSDNRALEAVIQLNNKALATSGNYRKFYEEGGQRFSHIIDPHSGYSAKQNLLSTSVIADDAITADAYATAFMVMGLDRSKQFLSDNASLNLQVYFIYDDHGTWKTYASESLKKYIKELL